MRYKMLDKNWLGYEVIWQGQHPWRALPAATAAPILGHAKYALYVKPGQMPMPTALRVDLRYFSKPRYM